MSESTPARQTSLDIVDDRSNIKGMARDDIRDELIETGGKLFARSGYTATGVKELVEATKIPKGSFYYYFSSKEVYAEAVVRRFSARNTEARMRLLNDHSKPPLARLRSYFEGAIASNTKLRYFEGCLVGNLTLEVADHSEIVRAGLQGALAVWQKNIKDVLVEASEKGELPDHLEPGKAAAFLLNSWQGALLRMKAEKSAAPLKLFVQTVFDHLLK
jgi:TetR/AcrR family transcriptional repressor of nem operon